MFKLHYSQCPICSSYSIVPVLNIKDASVSKEIYVIWECNNCNLRFTQDVPDEKDIIPYYQSEDYISHSNTSKGFLNKVYQLVRKYTVSAKAKLVISNTVNKGNILDIGAGVGAFLNIMRQKGWNTIGIEPDNGARQRAMKLYNLDLKESASLKNLNEATFDAITLWHVLEHVHQLHEYVEMLKVLLKPSGKVLIAVPNYTSLDSRIYQEYWAAYDVPRHLYHFSPDSMKILIENHGMKIKAIKPMWFDSFYISFISSSYKNGNTNWLSALGIGLRSNLNAIKNNSYCSSLIYIVTKN